MVIDYIKETHGIVQQCAGATLFTSAIAMGYRKFVWNEDATPLLTNTDNQNEFMQHVAKLQSTVAIAALAAVGGLVFGLLAGKAFVALLVLSPVIVGVSVAAIYILRHNMKAPEQQPQIIVLTELDVQYIQESSAYLQAKKLSHDSSLNGIQSNTRAIQEYWGSLTDGELLKEADAIHQTLVGIYTEFLNARCVKFSTKSFFELARSDMDFDYIPQELLSLVGFVSYQYEQAALSAFSSADEGYVEIFMEELSTQTFASYNPAFVAIALQQTAPKVIVPSAPPLTESNQ